MEMGWRRRRRVPMQLSKFSASSTNTVGFPFSIVFFSTNNVLYFRCDSVTVRGILQPDRQGKAGAAHGEVGLANGISGSEESRGIWFIFIISKYIYAFNYSCLSRSTIGRWKWKSWYVFKRNSDNKTICFFEGDFDEDDEEQDNANAEMVSFEGKTPINLLKHITCSGQRKWRWWWWSQRRDGRWALAF